MQFSPKILPSIRFLVQTQGLVSLMGNPGSTRVSNHMRRRQVTTPKVIDRFNGVLKIYTLLLVKFLSESCQIICFSPITTPTPIWELVDPSLQWVGGEVMISKQADSKTTKLSRATNDRRSNI